MELFLNSLWVLIALCAVSIWRVCYYRGPRARRKPWQEWAAVVCSLVFLFFAVSLSDDLHANLVLFDESGGARRQSVVVAGIHTASHSHDRSTPTVDLSPRFGFAQPFYTGINVVPLTRFGAPFSEVARPRDRAPPVSSL